MRATCNNPRHTDFKDYGGRGVSVCPEWGSFSRFFADMGQRPEGKTLDRIDVNGHYSPSNCRWADAKTQANNKRTNRLIEHKGEVKTLSLWCSTYGVEPSKVRYRLKQGWDTAKAFSSEDFRR